LIHFYKSFQEILKPEDVFEYREESRVQDGGDGGSGDYRDP